ncbi:MAG: formylglycine-generating enzyme family protein, partial [Candidatus Symbiothrix sp.]|nr:formylglycine-generating enzyme family protein [Candidatus Symbiothrix sp.]
QEFIHKLNQQTGKKYRLPTEAEWEFAARGGNQSRGYKYSGSNTADNVAWYYENAGDYRKNDSNWSADEAIKNRTHPVGTKQANELGIYDMSGNVWEWCSDWYGKYSSDSQTNPKGANSGSSRVYRGGSCGNFARIVRVSYRINLTPDNRGSILGFRLASSSN